jgi:cyclic pyranopterin phosphate synthase
VIRDTFARPLRNLRLSVTDRCNLRCAYCMPEEEYTWLPRADILTFEEIARLVGVFADLGVDKVRFTGGEPLLRTDLPRLVRMIAAEPRIRELAITTNGILLAQQAQALREAGIHRVTVSLDTLKPDRFLALTRRDTYAQVLEGIEAIRHMGWPGLKLDTVVMRGVNDDEIVDLVEFARRMGVEVRFIEYMDVGGATRWSMDQVVSRAEILERLGAHYGRIEPIAAESSSAPADRFSLPDGQSIGIISSTTAPFCRACDRSRLTADGQWLLCLYATTGMDLRGLLRSGVSNLDVSALIVSAWKARQDRGAEERLALTDRRPLVQIGELRAKPHLEMHTRGG